MSKPPPRKKGIDERTEGRRPPAPRDEDRDPSANQDGSDGDNFTGLCKNCQNRFDCLLPRPEGGVWHCEEYR